VSDWQPIETAPKDGTVFLASGTIYGDYGYTQDEEATFKCQWSGGRWSMAQPTGRYFVGFDVDTWMPIPKPRSKRE
jgi:hypothetical protein